MSAVRLAPSWAAGARRVALIVLVSALISGAVYAINGPPSAGRLREKLNDVYGPTMPFGLVQFVGQGLLLAAGVWAARRWLKIRL